MGSHQSLALVTGASGYIGRYLVEALVASGWRVRATGRRPVLDLPLPAPATYMAADLVADDLSPLVDNVTTVFHLAGASSSKSSVAEMQRINVEGTDRLVAAAAACVETFVHMSSTSVYGEESPLVLPVTEDAAGYPSRSYGKAKWGAEEKVWQAAGQGLGVVVLRPVTVFGPGAVKLLASAALDVAIERQLGRTEVVAPHPIIEQRLVHIHDLVAACLHLCVPARSSALGRAFNVAGLYPTSEEVTTALAEAYGMDCSPGEALAEEPALAERQRAYGELRSGGVTEDILFTPERFRFLRKANLNNRLSSAALDSTGFSFAHANLVSSVADTVAWYRHRHWLP